MTQTDQVEAQDLVSILNKIEEIRQLPDTYCIDHVFLITITDDADLIYEAIPEEQFEQNIDGDIRAGYAIGLPFPVGIMPKAVAEWLEENVDALVRVANGIDVFWDVSDNKSGQLTMEGQKALEELGENLERAFGVDGDSRESIIVRWMAYDWITSDNKMELLKMKSEEQVIEWARDSVNDGCFFMSDDGPIIVDVDEAINHTLELWRMFRDYDDAQE